MDRAYDSPKLSEGGIARNLRDSIVSASKEVALGGPRGWGRESVPLLFPSSVNPDLWDTCTDELTTMFTEVR